MFNPCINQSDETSCQRTSSSRAICLLLCAMAAYFRSLVSVGHRAQSAPIMQLRASSWLVRTKCKATN